MALGHMRHRGDAHISPPVSPHIEVCGCAFGCLQVKSAVGPSGKPVSRGGAHRCSSLLVFLFVVQSVDIMNHPIALMVLFVFCFLDSFQTPCQQELDQVLERISTMRLPDERGPLEHLYSLHIPNCDKHGLYNLKQASGVNPEPQGWLRCQQWPSARCTSPPCAAKGDTQQLRAGLVSHTRCELWGKWQISHVAWAGLVTPRCICSPGLASGDVRPTTTRGCGQPKDGESV